MGERASIPEATAERSSSIPTIAELTKTRIGLLSYDEDSVERGVLFAESPDEVRFLLVVIVYWPPATYTMNHGTKDDVA